MEFKTIAALATPPGVAGLAIIRVSGKNAFEIMDMCFQGKQKVTETSSHSILYGNIVFEDILIDNVTISIYKEPKSYTGENVVEIGCHGGLNVYNTILDVLHKCGAIYAEAGEFTRRAFLNGKLNLIQAEAVADIIHSTSVAGSQTAARQLAGNFNNKLIELRNGLLDIAGLLELELDFAEEGLEFVPMQQIIEKIEKIIEFCDTLISTYSDAKVLRSGYFVSIVGYPNAGKSSLFNALLKRERAIISHIPGTTRDYLEERLTLNGILVHLTDTAGIRQTDDIVEIQGIKLVESILEQSNLIMIINDINYGLKNSIELEQNIKSMYPDADIVILHNKTDLVNDIPETEQNEENTFYISATKGSGIFDLRNFLADKASLSLERVSDILLNERHYNLLSQTKESLKNAIIAINNDWEKEFIADDVRKAVRLLGELTGETYSEEVINHIFGKFCIGK